MTLKTSSFVVPVWARAALLCALALIGLGLSWSVLAQEEDTPLEEDIRILVLNTWDQKMARQYQMEMEMPATEVEARLEIVGRWAEAIEQGAFGADAKLPEGFAKDYEGMTKLVQRAKESEGVDLDPVLLFLENNVPALQKASGMSIQLPV